MKQNSLMKGILLALSTALISGVSIFYAKVAMVKIDPLVLTASRNLFVGFIFLILVFATKRFKEIKQLSVKQRILLVLVGIIGGSIPFYLFFNGLQMVGAQQANIIHKTLFIWVALGSFLFLKEKISIGFLVSGFLVFVGTFVFAPVKVVGSTGFLMILAATLFWSVETLVVKRLLDNASSELVGLSRMFLGGIILVGATLLSGKGAALLSLTGSQFAVIALGGSLLFFYVFTWFKALSYAPAGLVTVLLTGSVVVGAVLNGIFQQVHLANPDLYSMGCIALGVLAAVFTGWKEIKNKLLYHESKTRYG